MAIFYTQLEGKPLPNSADAADCGGGYINCWVQADSAATAKTLAEKTVADCGWGIVSVEEECQEVNADLYSGNPDVLAYFRAAEAGGKHCEFNKWPKSL